MLRKTGSTYYFLEFYLPLLIVLGKVHINNATRNTLMHNIKKNGKKRPQTIVWLSTIYKHINGTTLKYLRQKFKNYKITFNDFLDFFIWSMENEDMNTHYRTIDARCNSCNISYDYILHMEHIEEEYPYMIKDLGYPVNKHTSFPHTYKSKAFDKNRQQYETFGTTYLSYYKNVSNDVYEKIIKYYDFDFRTYGYKIPTYKEITQM